MTSIDDIRKEFSQKLDQEKAAHEQRTEKEKQVFENTHITPSNFGLSEKVLSSLEILGGTSAKQLQTPPPVPKNAQFLINITQSDQLKALDDVFLRMFNIPSFYPADKFTYITKLCTSLEEFFSTFVTDENISAQAKTEKIAWYVNEFTEDFKSGKPVIWGVNFPGQGCYVNGAAIAQKMGIRPDEIVNNKKAFQEVLENVIHEKIGHGFLSVYSTFGQIGTRLGLTLVQIASQFGIAPADDAEFQLKYRQQEIHFSVSKFLEEGWSTWVENYLQDVLLHTNTHPKHSLRIVADVLSRLPYADKEPSLQALSIIFGDNEYSMDDYLIAVQTLAEIDNKYYKVIGDMIGQPLRYAFGELLFTKCEVNMGAECVPFAALIAGNVSFDPAKVSLSDLDKLLRSDPRVNPDARLAAISRIKLDQSGNVKELAQKANSQLSLIIPVELR